MKSFLGKHQDRLLVVLGLILLGVLAAYFIWGGMALAEVFTKAINPPVSEKNTAQFDIQGAQGLGVTIPQ